MSDKSKIGMEPPRLKILLVDDNPASLQSMAAALEELGEVLLTATCGEEALKLLLKHDVAVIVTDVVMGGMDGFELAGLVRSHERFRNTPIIFLTGINKEDHDVLRGYSKGGADYLLKPCDPDLLRYKVKVFLELARKSTMLENYADILQQNSVKLEHSLQAALRAKAQLESEIRCRQTAESARDILAGKLAAMPGFVDAMAEGALTLSDTGTILYCNQRFCELVGAESSELVGRSIHEFVAPGLESQLDALLTEGRTRRANGSLEMVNRSGALIPVQLAASAFGEDGSRAIAIVVTDLRSQKRNEEILRDGKLARLIMEYSLSGIAVCDSLGRIVLASRTVHSICGENPCSRIFDDALSLVVRDGRERPFSIAEVLGGKPYKCVEVALSRAAQRSVPLLMSAAPMNGEDGVPIGCVVFLIDISDRKLIEDMLRRSEKFAAAGKIAGTLAHEVNNPLAAVTNIVYLLQQNASNESDTQKYLDLAASELSRMSHIVKNTLSFYKESSIASPVRVSELVDGVLELFSSRTREKEIEVVRDYQFDGELVAFPTELRQLLSNLVVNSLDAMPRAGRLHVKLRRARDQRSGRSGVGIVIADTGMGIPRDLQEKVFEPFFTTKGEKGTGLGLWVSESIVRKHHGYIRCRSRSERGTVFSIFLPTHSALSAVAATGNDLNSAIA